MNKRSSASFGLFFLGLGLWFGSSAPAARAAEPAWPSVQGWVTDQAKILSPEESAKVTGVITEVRNKTGAEIAIVTVKSIAPLDDASYANQLFSRLKIGKKGQDNGVLFLLALEERRTRIEVGYGLEDVLNDGKCGRILDEFVIPYFKQGDWGQGLYNGTMAIAQVVAQKYGVTLDLANPVGQPAADKDKTSLGGLLLQIFILIIIMIVFRGFWPLFFLMGGTGFRGGGFSGWSGGSGGGGFGGFGGFGGGFSGGGGAGRGF